MRWPFAAGRKDSLLDRFPVPVEGRRVLALGGATRALAEAALDRRAASVDLLTADPEGSAAGGVSNDRLHVHSSMSPDELAELGEARFDLLISCDALCFIAPTEAANLLRWALEHLHRDADALLDIPTFLGGAISEHLGLSVDRPQLLFPRRTLEQYAEEQGSTTARYLNPSCAATWLMLLHRVGFEILDVDRVKLPVQGFADKLQFYDSEELATDRLRCALRPRPEDPTDELRRTRR